MYLKMKRKKMVLICCLLGICSLFLGIYLNSSNSLDKKNESKKEEKTTTIPKENYQSPIPQLIETYQNEEIVGQLLIPSINLSQPILKTTDNDYYLTHDIYRNETTIGAIFIDFRTEDINTAKQLNIYGHNSDYYPLPFHVLENYQQEDFFQANQDIYIRTDIQQMHYKIFAVNVIEPGSAEHMIISYQKERFVEHVLRMREESILDTKEEIKQNDQILVIQTCLFNPDGRKLLLLAKKTELK